MTVDENDIENMVFRRSDHVKLSMFGGDWKTFNVLGGIDGKRSVGTIAVENFFDLDQLKAKVKQLYDEGLIQPVTVEESSRGHAKQILDAIIHKRARGISSIAKTIKIKMALKGINPDRLTENTPDDPVLLNKLKQLAQSYGIDIQEQAEQPERSKGKTKLILDTIIIQRSGGNPTVAKTIRTKLMLKGLNPDAYTLDTPDDPAIIRRLTTLAEKLGVIIPTDNASQETRIDQIL